MHKNNLLIHGTFAICFAANNLLKIQNNVLLRMDCTEQKGLQDLLG
jgi:hypothetical protein